MDEEEEVEEKVTRERGKRLLPNIWDKFKDGLINMFKEEDDRHL